MYFLHGKVGFENGQMTMEYADDAGEIQKIVDLENYVKNIPNHNNDVCELVDDFEEFLRSQLVKYLDCQIKESGVYIPSNFASFVESQRSKWISTAIEALNYQENVHYIVHGGQIKPVDFNSTGTVQTSTVWSDGLHQFLQLKHNLKLTSETVTTNFLSNPGFIAKYGMVYGLSGTLGTENTKDFLKDVYKVEIFTIPSRREKQFLELKSAMTFTASIEMWLQEVTSNLEVEIKKGRGCLVICETIEDANHIYERLKQTSRHGAIKLYTQNGIDQEKDIVAISPGEVIIATNLAGRGTDINTDKIEATGGLHVILTFMPNSQRVEDQAFGRTSRQGKRGTGVFILKPGNYNNTNDNVKEERDKAENVHLQSLKEKDLKVLHLKDKLFVRFNSCLNDNIRTKIRQDTYSNWRKVVNLFTELLPTTYETCVLAAAEEQWAEFLRKLEEGEKGLQDAEKRCEELIRNLETDFICNKLIKNPYYHIIIANEILADEWGKIIRGYSSTNIKKALEHYKSAIKLDQDHYHNQDLKNPEVYCSGSAYVGIAWCHLLLKEDGYKDLSLNNLKLASNCISNEMGILSGSRQILRQLSTGFKESDLDKQFDTKSTILGSYVSGISRGMEAIKRSKRMMDLEAKKCSDLHWSKICYTDQEKDDEGKFKNLEALSNDKQYSLTFHHLTTRYDCGERDQALTTMDKSFGTLSRKNYQGFEISMSQADMTLVKETFFQTFKEFKNLCRKSAIAKIKEERTYGHAFRISESYEADLVVKKVDQVDVVKKYYNKQLNKLLDIIEDDPLDSSLRYDLLIKRSNENAISKLFDPNASETESNIVKLNICFGSLDKSSALEKLKAVKAKACDMEFVLDSTSLLELISKNDDLKFGILDQEAKPNTNKQRSFVQVDRETLQQRLKQQSKSAESPCYIRFDDLSIKEAIKIAESCADGKTVMFLLHFKDIYDFHTSNINDGMAEYVKFSDMKEEHARSVIQIFRKSNLDFSLKFKDLSCKEVKYIVRNADLSQEDMKIENVKRIDDMYLSNNAPHSELDNFLLRGLEFILEINERRFVPWWSVCAVAALSAIQVIGGVALIITGFGASVGMGLVTEGIADAFTAYRAFSNRQFSWQDYVSQKAVSLAISVVSAGFSKSKMAIQDATKGISSISTKSAIKQAGKQVGQVSKTIVTTGSNLKSLAFKYVATKGSEALAREVLNSGIRYLSEYSFSLLKPSIVAEIQNSVRNSVFNNSNLRDLLYKMKAIDLALKSQKPNMPDRLKNKVDTIVMDIINPRQDFVQKHWNAIGLPLLKGVLADSHRYSGVASMALRIVGTLSGMKEVVTLVDKTAEILLQKLTLSDRNTMTFNQLLFSQLKIKSDQSATLAGLFKASQLIGDQDALLEMNEEDLKIKKKYILKSGRVQDIDHCIVIKSISFVEDVYNHFWKMDHESLSIILKSITDKLTDKMIQILDSQILQPWTTYAVSCVTAHVSEVIQHHLISSDQNSKSQAIDQNKYDLLSSKRPENLTKEERTFMKNYGRYRTFAQQINYNKNDYCIAYSQAEMAYYSSKSSISSGTSNSLEANTAAENILHGMPANLAIMMAAANARDITLKIVDDKNYVKSKEDKKNKIEVIYVEHCKESKLPGHAYYMNDKGRFEECETKGMDCFYGAFSKILEKRTGQRVSVQDLRWETAQHIKQNGAEFAKAQKAENWIRERHPERSQQLCFEAGLKKKFVTVKDESGNEIETYRFELEDEDLQYLEETMRLDLPMSKVRKKVDNLKDRFLVRLQLGLKMFTSLFIYYIGFKYVHRDIIFLAFLDVCYFHHQPIVIHFAVYSNQDTRRAYMISWIQHP